MVLRSENYSFHDRFSFQRVNLIFWPITCFHTNKTHFWTSHCCFYYDIVSLTSSHGLTAIVTPTARWHSYPSCNTELFPFSFSPHPALAFKLHHLLILLSISSPSLSSILPRRQCCHCGLSVRPLRRRHGLSFPAGGEQLHHAAWQRPVGARGPVEERSALGGKWRRKERLKRGCQHL